MQPELMHELGKSLSTANLAHREDTLRRMTDLFVSGSSRFSAQQIALFDDIFDCLVTALEGAALVALANRMAPLADAPPHLITRLATDDDISVAGPVLTQSPCLTDAILIDAAWTKSQAHLVAIANRKAVAADVTDVLVARGDEEVVQSVTKNSGAQFSENGFAELVRFAQTSETLALTLAARTDVPRNVFLQLLAEASEAVRHKLIMQNAHAQVDIDEAVRLAAGNMRQQSAAQDPDLQRARTEIVVMQADQRLTENDVIAFAHQQRFAEMSAALAAFSRLPVDSVEAWLGENPVEACMMLGKFAHFAWPTVSAMLQLMSPRKPMSASDIEQCRINYERLKTTTAQQVVRHHKMKARQAS